MATSHGDQKLISDRSSTATVLRALKIWRRHYPPTDGRNWRMSRCAGDNGGGTGEGWNKKGSPYSITDRRVPELIPVLDSQPADDVSHKPGGRLPLLSARPAVTPATLKRAAINFCCFVNRGTMSVNSLPKSLPDSVATAI